MQKYFHYQTACVLSMAISTAGQAAEKINLTKDNFMHVSSSIIKICPILHPLLDGLEISNSSDAITTITIPYVQQGAFKDLLNILTAVETALYGQDICLVQDDVLQSILKPFLTQRSCQSLLDVTVMADYVGVQSVMSAASSMWAQKCSGEKTDFAGLNENIQQILIKKLTPFQLISLVKANPHFTQSSKDKIATYAFQIYQNKIVPIHAWKTYEETFSDGYVLIPSGTYMVGAGVKKEYRWDNEDLKEVSLHAFEIMEAVVTQKQFALKGL